MKKTSTLLLIIMGLALPIFSAIAADGTEHLWEIRIQPLDDESGNFLFDASLKHSSSSEGRSSQDELRVPRMNVVPGKEANIEIKAPDGRSMVTARVLIDDGGMKVRYSVMIRTEDGIHRSSADLDLSGKQTRQQASKP